MWWHGIPSSQWLLIVVPAFAASVVNENGLLLEIVRTEELEFLMTNGKRDGIRFNYAGITSTMVLMNNNLWRWVASMVPECSVRNSTLTLLRNILY